MWSEFDCVMCASGAMGGELSLSWEARGDEGQWTTVSAEAYRLCPACYRFCTEIMASSSAGEHSTPPVFGMPVAHPSTRGAEGHCEACSAQLPRKRYVVGAVPAVRRETPRTSPLRIQRNHVCRQCFVWWRMLLRDAASLRGRRARRSEGPLGSWTVRGLVDVAIASLEDRDRQMVEDVVRASKGRVLSFSQVFRERDQGRVALFVHAGKRDRATDLVSSLPAWLRGDAAVVTHPDFTDDAFAAMRAGAGELLVSPLSPQQVVGAMERIRDIAARPAKDPATGLPRFSPRPSSQITRPLHALVVRGLAPGDFGLAVVHLRRFTRGYDQVGVTASGEPCALVDCPEADLPAVKRRLSAVFSGLATVETSPGSAPFGLAAA